MRRKLDKVRTADVIWGNQTPRNQRREGMDPATVAAVSVLEKVLTVWGPLALGWIGFFGLLIFLIRARDRREDAALRALQENAKAVAALERALDKVHQIR